MLPKAFLPLFDSQGRAELPVLSTERQIQFGLKTEFLGLQGRVLMISGIEETAAGTKTSRYSIRYRRGQPCGILTSCIIAATIWSKDTGIDRNPADQVEVRRPDDQRDRYLSEHELRRLKHALDEKIYRKGTKDFNKTFCRLRMIVLIAVTTGMRASEIFSPAGLTRCAPKGCWPLGQS